MFQKPTYPSVGSPTFQEFRNSFVSAISGHLLEMHSSCVFKIQFLLAQVLQSAGNDLIGYLFQNPFLVDISATTLLEMQPFDGIPKYFSC